MSFNPRWSQVTDQQIHNWCQKAPDLHTAAAAWVHEIPEDQVTPELRNESKMILFGRIQCIAQGHEPYAGFLNALEVKELWASFQQMFPKLASYFDPTAPGTR